MFHSRSYSPTRRLALGRSVLPLDPPPGFGPLLLGGIVAVGADELDAEDRESLLRLMTRLERDLRVVQPQVRNRFQTDHQGLARTVGRLEGEGQLEFDFDGNGSPLQMALAATYAAGGFPVGVRPRVFDVLRKGLAWLGRDRPSTHHAPVGPHRTGVVERCRLWRSERLGTGPARPRRPRLEAGQEGDPTPLSRAAPRGAPRPRCRLRRGRGADRRPHRSAPHPALQVTRR